MKAVYDAQHQERSSYTLLEHETPFGHSFGNLKAYASSTPKGGIRGLWDADCDQIIFGTHQLAYRINGAETVFPKHITREFTFLPHAQVSRFTVDGRIAVEETFYVPCGPKHDRTVGFVVDVNLHNTGDTPCELAVFAWSLLVGQRFYGELEASVSVDTVDGTLIRARNPETGASRRWGGSRRPNAMVVGLREQAILRGIARGSLADAERTTAAEPGFAEHTGDRVFGALDYRITLGAQESTQLRMAVVFHLSGDEEVTRRYNALMTDSQAYAATEAAYAERMSDARFLTPSPEISRAVVWAKANMLRVVKEYPKGYGSTNSPPSDILVSRDTSWFVHGYDYMMPDFSRAAIEVFSNNLDAKGQVVEYVRGVSGFATSYDLNINDDTPLHIIAILHHYLATGDKAWLATQINVVVRIADYLLTQRDKNGLVSCIAGGVDMFGITSWRNIIPQYTLDGAVTEINAEAVFALRAAARLSKACGRAADDARFAAEADAMQKAMLEFLYSEETVGFVLNYDRHGNYQDNFTADEIFPVLFEIADKPARQAILKRLSGADFLTPVGLRTVSTADSWYSPSYGFGLLGGVWPDLTLWYIAALARNGFLEAAADRLSDLALTMEAGSPRNTVPGEFAEWYDGGSLTNRGMYLSPWTGPKYLWAVAETVCGLDGYRTSDVPHVAPLLPPQWRWSAGARVRRGDAHFSYVIDAERKEIYTDSQELTAELPFRAVYSGNDVTSEAVVSPAEVACVVFAGADGTARAFLGNLNDRDREAKLCFRDVTIRRALRAGELAEITLADVEAAARV